MSCYLCGNESREQKPVIVLSADGSNRRLVLCCSCHDTILSGEQWTCWHELKP